jgi:hypothetical protein
VADVNRGSAGRYLNVSRRTLKASGYSGPLKGADCFTVDQFLDRLQRGRSVNVGRRTLKASGYSGPLKGADCFTVDQFFDRLQPVRF